MSHPEISVVMGVYNSAPSLSMTINSVLSQEGVDIEFIVVDDGSTDGSGELLDRYAQQDSRLRVFHQPNSGLTAALVKGCKEARGEFIARQDAGGDVSLPRRLFTQLQFIKSRPDAVMVTCGTRFVGPNDQLLFDKVIAQVELNNGLNTLRIPGISGPSSHPSTLFSRTEYDKVGGYRKAFLLAQDLDLWLRLSECGECATMPEVLYRTCWALGSLTSRLRKEQLYYAEMALECARRRRSGQKEPLLPAPDQSQSLRRTMPSRRERANFHYFIGSCLAERSSGDARGHYIKALRVQPFHVKALWRLLALKN